MHILCIDDDEGLLYLLRSALENTGHTITAFTDSEEGFQHLSAEPFDAVIVDHEMPKMTGLEVLFRARSLKSAPPIIMVTGAGNEEIAAEAIRLGASDYVVKDTQLGYLKIIPSVIEQVVHERELAQKHQAIARAFQLERDRSRLLSEFIQNASHEFRTPLTLIQMALDSLGRISPDEKQQKHIQRIKQQSDAILTLVDSLIHLTKLDNTSALPLEPVVLNSLIKAAVEQAGGMIEAKALQFTLELPDQPLRIRGDRVELASALVELIRNACTYSNPDGMLTITLERGDSSAIITIRDTGIGMTGEQVSRMFERFYRADKAHTTRGFGLGLPVVARVIDLHHGEIGVTSEINQGTTITISLPLHDD